MADAMGMNGADQGGVATAPPPAVPQPSASPWADAAKSAETNAPPTQSADLSGQKIPQQSAQTVPVPITPLKRPGLLGVMDSVADALAGKTRPELGTDPDGNKYIKQQTLTRGQQWMKIAGEAFSGAAAGLAAGRGRGNEGKAAMAGVEEGEHIQDRQNQSQQEMQGEVDKDQLAKANNQMLQMKLAEHNWTMAQNQTKATEDQIKFNEGQIDRLTAQGGKIIGTAAHPGDIAEIMKVQPDVMEQLVKKGTIQIRSNIGEDGKVNGITAILMPQDWGKTMLPGGETGHYFDPVKGQVQEFKYSDPVSQGEVAANDAAAIAAQNDFLMKKATLGKTQQETATSATEASKNKAQITLVPSEINKNNAEASKARADANQANLGAGAGDEGSALVDEIGTGHMPVGRMSYLLARKPELLGAVAKKYPDFDASKVESYASTYKDFTEGKVSTQINAGATALGHLRELEALNTPASHIPHTAAWTAYQNKVDTLSTELAKFYGDATIPAIQFIKDTLASTLPGNRHSAIKTQAQSMSDKFNSFEQQWKNAAPSKEYQAPMPGMSEQAKDARAALDPAYKAQRVAEMSKNPQAAQAARVQPGEPTAKGADGSLLVVRNGQWVPAQP